MVIVEERVGEIEGGVLVRAPRALSLSLSLSLSLAPLLLRLRLRLRLPLLLPLPLPLVCLHIWTRASLRIALVGVEGVELSLLQSLLQSLLRCTARVLRCV